MLARLRHTADNFLMKLLIILLVASFALWGVGDMIRASDTTAVATVGTEEITDVEYRRELEKLRTSLGEHFTPEIIRTLRLYDLTLAGLIGQRLIGQEAQRMHILPGDELVKQMLSTDTRFRDASGKFDRDLFAQHVRQSGMDEQSYLHQLEDDAREYIFSSTIAPPALFDDALPALLYRVQHEQRSAMLYVVDADSDSPVAVPQDDDLRLYYDAHRETYMAPELRVLRYILLDKGAVERSVVISEEELQSAYFERQKELLTPEKRDVTQLLYSDKAQAEQVYGLLRSGVGLAKARAEVPPTNQDNTELGLVTQAQLPVAAETIFALNEGDFSTPIQSDFGWHVFIVNKVQESFTPSFESLKAQLRSDIARAQVNKTLVELVEKVEDTMAAGMTLEDIAETLGVEFYESAPLSRDGKHSDNTVALDAQRFDGLLESGFTLSEGGMSDVKRLEDGTYFVVKALRITPARQRALEEVRGLVAQDWQKAQLAGQREQRAQAVRSALQAASAHSHAEVMQLLADQGVTHLYDLSAQRTEVLSVTPIITQTQKTAKDAPEAPTAAAITPDQIPVSLIATLFDARQPYTMLDPLPFGEGYLGAVYLEASIPDVTPDDPAYQDIVKRLSKHYEQEISQQYLNALRQRYPVQQDAQALSRVIGQFQ